MKKIIIFLTLLLPISLWAQELDEKKYTLVAFAGLNSYKLKKVQKGIDSDSNIGYQLGGSMRYGKNRLYTDIGVGYHAVSNTLASKVDTGTVISDIKDDVKFSFLHIPWRAGFHLFWSRDHSSNIRVFAGPALNVMLGVSDNDYKIEKEDFNALSATLNFGAGVDLWVISLEAQYHLGLSDVFEETFENSSQPKGDFISFNLGIKL
ncbi:MAG TPA: outer membrane beta-barrel protein [Bacteroidia bacterium]|nr:outer membrane beta-barrel protein [Bacteroidia bacterium]HNT80607.1 outer membrane beta-barrel protein [Bacteroidia bacterium]